jgi:hypothetical protein
VNTPDDQAPAVLFPENAGPLLHAILGGREPEPGPPYVHTHRLPSTDDETEAWADAPSLTIKRG